VTSVEKLCDLLFEASNEDRLKIMVKLDTEPMNITRLSRELSLSTQETSRHISRLGEVGLTVKDPDGLHALTPYGMLALRQLTGLEFVSRHGNYFSTHALEGLPQEHVSRIGELVDCVMVDHVLASWGNVEDVISEAEECVWAVTDQYHSTTYRLMAEALDRGVTLRLIEPRDWAPLPQHEDDIRPAEVEAFNRARAAGTLQERIVEGLDFFLYMSEKRVAAIAFPTLDGRLDYTGFSSADERAHGWCRDLFRHYWENAEPRREFVIK
jgi:predicted transcriptional regulator